MHLTHLRLVPAVLVERYPAREDVDLHRNSVERRQDKRPPFWLSRVF